MKFVSSIFLVVMLSGCTFAVHDPNIFEREATHLVKEYNIPKDTLFGCFISRALQAPNFYNYSTPEKSEYGYAGFTKVEFINLGKSKTRVRASGLMPNYNPKNDFPLVDACAVVQ